MRLARTYRDAICGARESLADHRGGGVRRAAARRGGAGGGVMAARRRKSGPIAGKKATTEKSRKLRARKAPTKPKHTAGPGRGHVHKPTQEQRDNVQRMAEVGISHVDIAAVLGIADKTLLKHYRDELDYSATKANVAVAQSLYSKALADGPSAVTAAIFWCKTRMRWKEASAVEHSGPEGGPIEIAADVSDEQLERQLRKLLAESAS